MKARAIWRAVAAFTASIAGAVLPAAGAPAPAEAADTVFGIRLGVPLPEQMPSCANAPDGSGRFADRPCWAPDPIGFGRTVKLSTAVFAELGMLSVRRVRESEGNVVEVEIEFPPSQVGRVERYLRKGRGAPAESERYERGGRLFGVRSVMLHTWRERGTTLILDEQSASDQGRVRAFVDRWAEEERRH